MAARPPPPPPRRRAPTLKKLRRMEARQRAEERPFDPQEAPARYARPHHFAVNPYPVEDLSGEQMSFPGSDPDDILATQQPYGAWSRGFGGDWFVPRWLGGSDYSGGYVTRANYLSFKEEWEQHDPPFFTETYGGHGTYGIVLYIPRTPAEVWEQLEKLEQYPLLDEDKLSELEREGAHEAWESWAKADYLRLWREATENDPRFAEDWMDDISDDAWWEHFDACASEANEYWHADGDTPSMTIDVERVFEACAEPPEPVGGVPDPHEAAIVGVGPDPEREGARDALRRRQIEELRQQLDRPYRRFEQNARKTINDLLAEDPYKGVRVGADLQNVVVNNIGRIVSQQMGLLGEDDPYEAATVLVRSSDGTQRIVFWFRVDDRYTIMWLDPEQVFETRLLRMGTVSDVQEWAESPVIGGDGRPHVHEDDWDIVLRSLHHRGKDALALYLEWYDRAGVQPTLIDYEKPYFYVDREVDWASMQEAFGPVFEVYERHKASVDDILGLLGTRGEQPARRAPVPTAPSGPSALELRRRRLIDYARAELDRPFPRRFEPNPAGGLFEWLSADPYAGVVVREDVAFAGMYEPGVVEANVLHDQDPHEMAGLVLRNSDGNPMLVLWYGSPEGSPRDYTAFFIDPTQLTKLLPVFSVKNVGAVQDAMEAEISPEMWEDVLTAINRTLTGDMQTTQYLAGLLLYLYWYFEAQLEDPSLAELAVEEEGEAVVVRSDVRAGEFEVAWNEVFAVAHSAPAPPPAPLPPSRASSAPSAAPSGQASEMRRRQIEYARQMLDRPFTRRFEENPSRLWEVRSEDEGLEGVFGDEAQAERYAETLRTELAVRARVVEVQAEKLPGGLAQGLSPEHFDPVELARGTFVEMEHTEDAELAREIAMDHLAEDPLYYQKLQAAGL